jgi:serine O-acetyltransferase
MFDNIRRDMNAQFGGWGAQGFWVLVVYRFGRWRYGIKPAVLRKPFSLIYRMARTS